jgi:murein L,D-transpeptidase YafK
MIKSFMHIPVLLMLFSSVMPAIEIPESARSRAAVRRIVPKLEAEMVARELKLGSPVFIRIFKESDELEVWVRKDSRYYHFRTWKICSWSGDLGPKLKEGDGQSPEGFYFIKPPSLNPSSRFHLSFNLGYPNRYDRTHGRTGSALMVHGNCVSIGCYAMTDPGIEEIYSLVHAALLNGQPFIRVHIFPFRMTDRNMRRHEKSSWSPFWKNLKQGYDHFLKIYLPPDVTVKDGAYNFSDQR